MFKRRISWKVLVRILLVENDSPVVTAYLPRT